jgi:hypothetical protein
MTALLEIKRHEEGARQSTLSRAARKCERARAELSVALEQLAARREERRVARAQEANARVATVEERLVARRWDLRLGEAVRRALDDVRAAEADLAAAEQVEATARDALAETYRAREALERHVERQELAEKREAERREERRS